MMTNHGLFQHLVLAHYLLRPNANGHFDWLCVHLLQFLFQQGSLFAAGFIFEYRLIDGIFHELIGSESSEKLDSDQ